MPGSILYVSCNSGSSHSSRLPSQQQYHSLKLNLRECAPAGVKTEAVPGVQTYLHFFAPQTGLSPTPIPGHILSRLSASISATSQPEVSSWGRSSGTGNGWLDSGRQNPQCLATNDGRRQVLQEKDELNMGVPIFSAWERVFLENIRWRD